jgi:hypothetical protein
MASVLRTPKRLKLFNWREQMASLRLLFVAGLSLASPISHSQPSQQDVLFQRALKATSCTQAPNNGRLCTYEFGSMLSISIKDVGGTDTVIGF